MADKLFAVFVFSLVSSCAWGQGGLENAAEEVDKFQRDLNEEYRDPKRSPLDSIGRANFRGHDFFPVDPAYRVVARLVVTVNAPFFQMKTTSLRTHEERVYGHVEFTLQGKVFKLPIYQSARLMKTDEYKDYLFFPFTDPTNGEETYHGGRYIDLRIPAGGEIVIDFNKAYNPYCAYATGYSCPIVPKENHLDMPVKAGILYHKKK